MFDLRYSNTVIGPRAKAFRLNPYIEAQLTRYKVELKDQYDIYSAQVGGYDILIEEEDT